MRTGQGIATATAVACICAGIGAGIGAGPAAALDDLRFSAPAADEDLVAALRNASLLIAAREEKTDNPADLLAAALADYSRLVGALYSEGYYGGTVHILIDGREATAIDPLNTPDRIGVISVEVRHGPVYRFSEAQIGPIAAGTELPEQFAAGQVAKSPAIQNAVDAAVSGWRDVGHAKADLAGQQIVARHDANVLAADVRIAPGPRLRFGQLEVTGKSALSERRVRRIANLPSGEVFDPDALDKTAKRLREIGVFRSVALVEADVPNPDGTLDITAQIVDLPPRRFGFGAEIQSEDGVTLTAYWLHRNLFGGAERFRVDGEVSNLGGGTDAMDYELKFDLSRPATFNPETDAVLSGRIASLNEPDYSEDTATLGFGVRRRYYDNIVARASVEYRFSDVTDDFGKRQYQQIFLPIGATYDTRETPLDARGGYYLDVEAAPFYGLSESESGARLTFDARTYRGFGEDDATVIAARLQAGSIVGASLTGLPNELRFYSGGGDTVRGQDYQILDVSLDDGRDSGGRSFLGVQTEVRRKVTKNISVVGFYDWGFIGADSWMGSDGESHSGAGLGLRYATAVGPIRVDLGVPVSGPDDASAFQIYIGIGQAF